MAMSAMNFEYEVSPTLYIPSIEYEKFSSKNNERSESELEPTKCRYNSHVLVGNWFERRAKYEPPPDDWITVYNSVYTCKTNPNLQRDKAMLRNNKKNAERGIGLEFLINNPRAGKNFTTTNDLFFQVLPKELCGPRERKYNSRKDLWLPEVDLTKEYGNLTNFRLNEPRPPSEPVKRFPKPIGKMNEPYLSHLDIDPSLPFKPHFVKVKN